jgi:hypothetical protein
MTTVRRTWIALLVTVVVVGATAAAALAGNPHLRKGSSISCTISTTGGGATNNTVTCTGTGGLAGLGNADWAFVLSGTGDVSYICRNQGGNEAAGQNRVPATIPPTTVSGTGADITNGNLAFFGSSNQLTSTATPVAASASTAGCPNDNWTARPVAVFWKTVTVVFQQPVPTVILTCTASNSSGLTGTFSLSC